MRTEQQELRREDPFAGLPLLISVPRTASCLASAGRLPTALRVRVIFPSSGLAAVCMWCQPSCVSSSLWRTRPHEGPRFKTR